MNISGSAGAASAAVATQANVAVQNKIEDQEKAVVGTILSSIGAPREAFGTGTNIDLKA